MTTIGKNIKRLRKEHKMTQEQLAEKLGISTQAVSKWEQETTSPDLSQIIPLTSIFGVSADLLLGITPDAEETAIDDAFNYCDMPGVTREEKLLRWQKLNERYPHNGEILYQMGLFYFYVGKADENKQMQNDNYQKAVACFEKILDEFTDEKLREKAIDDLHLTYNFLNDTENAVRVAKMAGDWKSLILLSETYGNKNKTEDSQRLYRACGEQMAWAIMGMEFSEEKTKIFAFEHAIKILDLTYCDGSKAWVSYIYNALYTELAKINADIDDEKMMYTYLEKLYDIAEFEDNLPLGEYKYPNNPLMDKLTYTHDASYTHMNRDNILSHIFDWSRSCFDKYKETERFKAYVEKVRNMPGIDYGRDM